MRRFGALFRAYREREGMLQSEAATRLGVSSSYLCNVEAGRAHPPVGRWRAFARVLRLGDAETRALRRCLPVILGLAIGAAAWGARTASVPVLGSRAVDGDTCDVFPLSSELRVRLLSVDTPERGQPLYAEARDFLEAFAAGSTLTLQQPKAGQVDPYGRQLGHLHDADGRCAGVELVREGLSRYHTRYGPDKLHPGDFEAAQAEAQAHGRGVWAP